MHKTILVTGANGFLGSHVASYFKEKKYTVIGLGNGKLEKKNHLRHIVDRWIQGEVNKENLTKINNKLSYIIHCAGGSSVEYSLLHPTEDFQKTVASTLAVLEYIKNKNKLAKFIYPSSVAVYGNTTKKYIDEDFPLKPISPYGLHKTFAEKLAIFYGENFGIKTGIIRFFSLYGPGLKKQLLWDSCEKIQGDSSKITFFGHGNEARDFLHISDAVKLIEKVALSKTESTIINGGSGIAIRVSEIITLLLAAHNEQRKVTFSKAIKKGYPIYQRAAITKAKNLDWKPCVNLKEGVQDYVEWYKKERAY